MEDILLPQAFLRASGPEARTYVSQRAPPQGRGGKTLREEVREEGRGAFLPFPGAAICGPSQQRPRKTSRAVV